LQSKKLTGTFDRETKKDKKITKQVGKSASSDREIWGERAPAKKGGVYNPADSWDLRKMRPKRKTPRWDYRGAVPNREQHSSNVASLSRKNERKMKEKRG
jgi:hypothetical protein